MTAVQTSMCLEEFYAADPRRAQSHQVSYGHLWRGFAPLPTSRLCWIQATGELYAMALTQPEERKCPVQVLGVLWHQSQVDACLAGWTERCGGQRSLLWAHDRVRAWRPVTEETQFTEAHPMPPSGPFGRDRSGPRQAS